MPKQQGGHFGERASRNTSKNAKDKSNSATLRASQSSAHREQTGKADLTNRMLRCDSEKDSGFSEAGSDSVNTDVDDQRSSASEPQRQRTSISNNGSNYVNAATYNVPPYKELTPVYVIKNVMVKPTRPEPLPHNPLTWGRAWHGLTGAKGPTQLLLIQQPAPITPSQKHLKKSSARSNQAHEKSYLPILKSYPRIAPHPRKESHESKAGLRTGGGKECGGEGQSRSKRVCTEEEKREAVSTTTHHLKPHQPQKDARVHSYSQRKSRSSHHSTTGQAHSTSHSKSHHSQQSANTDSISSPSVSSSQTRSPPCSSDSSSSPSTPPSSSPSSSAAHSPYRPNPDSTSMRDRRFFNTAEILNQSGLLAITLRTKELLKQNAETEREIAQLRQHTQYLCQAALASQAGSKESLEKLVQAMSESGSYPELGSNQLTALTNQQSRSDDDKTNPATNAMPTVISLHNMDDGTSPPSPLFAPSPEAAGTEHANALLEDLDQARGAAVTDKDWSDLTMLPESSTHPDYLL
ncbi:uncharacterized protein [Eucyclogobius newberryi]|uniref:uncharacterized protein n=1 Tax=Eucyclogobius newberryi TaxID=166745 RepID=UPI003B5A9E2A